MTDTAACARQALATAERLLPVEAILDAVPADNGSLDGLAGTALLHARLATLDPVFENAALRHWTQAATRARWHPDRPAAGIFPGPGGLAASLIIGSTYLPDPERVHDATARAARWLSTQAVDLARRHHDTGTTTTPWAVYDVINGLAGTGRILLAATQDGHRNAEPGLLAALNTLTTMTLTGTDTRPGWRLPAHAHPPGVTIRPSGAATTGMAHGIAGPLALLAIAHTHGYTVTGQADAIRTAADWLLHWRTGPHHDWPPHITGDELDRDTPHTAPGRHDAWCYGTPGISRALTLAGHALNDPGLITVGRDAIASLADRAHNWDAEGPTLCHGHAGILQCATTSPPTATRAANAVAAAFDAQHTFAFQHLHSAIPADDPGLLTGAAGIALALADRANHPTPAARTRWEALLLLS